MEVRPEIFQYHNHLLFLRDWLAYRKASQPGFSIRSLAKQAGLASGYIPMVLSGKRVLSGTAMAKLAPFLDLNASERSFFESLVVLGTSDSHEARISSLEKMKRFSKFQKLNPNETETYEYLNHWYFVAIREMSALKGFVNDPEWVQSQLKFAVPLRDIKNALDFLIENKYIEVAKDGSILPPSKAIECSGGIYRVALAQFHHEIYSLASQAIDTVPSAQRDMRGYTLSLSESKFDEARKIAEEAMEKIRKLGEAEKEGDTVYHMEVALFPLTSSAAKKRGQK